MLALTKEQILWQEARPLFTAERVDLSPWTQAGYGSTLDRLFKEKDIRNVGRPHILMFLQQYKKASSYNANLYAIKSFFAWASEYYQFPNPAINLRCKKQSGVPDVRVITEDEYAAICRLSGQYRDIAVFLANTGLRAAEFCNMRPEHVHGNHLTVTGKGNKIRRIPLNETALLLLKNYHSLINFNLKKSHYYKQHNLKYASQWLAETLGIKQFGPHALRHRYATQLLQLGARIEDVSRLLGHSSIQITISRYYHPPELDSTVHLLDDSGDSHSPGIG